MRKVFLILSVYLGIATGARAEMFSTLITGPVEKDPSFGNDFQFNYANVNRYIKPSETHWIAFNGDFNDVMMEDVLRPGEKFLGPNGVGIDDYIKLTITNPDGEIMIRDMDKNDIASQPIGPQAIIFNTTEVPVIRRGNTFIEDEQGVFNSLFTKEGVYNFQFSFRDSFGGAASNGSTYLLVSAIPEPSSVLLSLFGIIGVIIWQVKRTVNKRTFV